MMFMYIIIINLIVICERSQRNVNLRQRELAHQVKMHLGQQFSSTCGPLTPLVVRNHLPGGPQASPNIQLILSKKYAKREMFEIFRICFI